MLLRLHSLLAVLLAFSATVSLSAADWWNSQWPVRKPLVVDVTSAGLGSETVAEPTVLVRLHEGVFNFAAAKNDLADLRFVSEDGKTEFPYHVEKIDALMNEAYVWVKIPAASAAKPFKFWAYYGNAQEGVAKVQSERDSWSASAGLVFHFSDPGSSAVDSTGRGVAWEGALARSEGGIIGGALRLDGRNALSFSGGTLANVYAGSPLTVSAWVKPAAEGNRTFLSWRSGRGSLVLGFENGIPFAEANGSNRQRASAQAPLGTWHHVAWVLTGDTVRFYVDGEPAGSASLTTPEVAVAPMLGGDRVAGTGFSGEVDELTVVLQATSPAALKFAAALQGPNGGNYLQIGADEVPQGLFHFLEEGYVGIILKSLTVDGWVVIVLLLVMSVISWWVMVQKARWLGRIAKGNEIFLKQWHEVSSDLSVIDSEDIGDARTMGGRITPESAAIMRESSLYKIYHVGVEEIRHRIAVDDKGGTAVIRSRSIHAIKAMLEGSLVRQTQKLNNGMVLLTIAISGGPFLGLLGTVVGVMITFAAVAQEGEVNVNAIAPGIAAALAATVAGLAVAIPALFGYNYLLTRIKGTTTDMTVFIDEFITKLAEFYGGEGE